MSVTTSKTTRDPAAKADKKRRQRHTPGGAGLGQEAGAEARRLAAAILEVLGGARTPRQAAEALGVSLPRYFQLETRAMQALVAGCAPRPRGRANSANRELAALKRQHERLERELGRQQSLVRLAQRSIGLAPPRPAAGQTGGKGKSKRRRRPVVRALRAAQALQQQSQEAQSQDAAAATAVPPSQPED